MWYSGWCVAAENINSSSRFALEKNFELDLWVRPAGVESSGFSKVFTRHTDSKKCYCCCCFNNARFFYFTVMYAQNYARIIPIICG